MALGTAIALATVVTPAAASHSFHFTSPDSNDGSPQNIAAGPDGTMWLTYADGNRTLVSIDPTGTFTNLTSRLPGSARPYDVATGPDGNAWLTEPGAGRIARITPAGVVTEFGAGVLDGTSPTGIVAGPDGAMWATLSANPGGIARVAMDGTVTVYTAGLVPNAAPVDIVSAQGALWFAYSGAESVGMITTAGVVTNTSPLLLAGRGTVNRVTADADGHVWATHNGTAFGTKLVSEIYSPTSARVLPITVGTFPFGLALGGDNGIWVGDRTGNKLRRLDANTGAETATESVGGSASIRATGTDQYGNIWAAGRGDPVRVWRVGVVAPTLGTVTATSIGTSSATISFPVNANGQPTDVVVNYGRSTLSSLASTSLSGMSSAPTTQTVTMIGLLESTRYQFKVSATNNSGQTVSEVMAFTTSGSDGTPGRQVADPGSSPAPEQTYVKVPAVGGGSVTLPADAQPVQGRVVVADAARGTVTVRLPGTRRDVPIEDAGQIPVGSVVDASKGTAIISTALPGGKVQQGRFWGSRFTVRQVRRGAGITNIITDRSHIPGCPTVYRAPAAPTPIATTAATELARRSKRRAKKRPRRVLWGSDRRGRFRTHGRNSVATVRGTRWVTVDTCTGTLTRVVEGAVVVRDKRLKKSVLVRAGRQYFARRTR
ncbi:MAG: hypothetical protein R2878_07290 [Thermoleophilia bacterium]